MPAKRDAEFFSSTLIARNSEVGRDILQRVGR